MRPMRRLSVVLLAVTVTAVLPTSALAQTPAPKYTPCEIRGKGDLTFCPFAALAHRNLTGIHPGGAFLRGANLRGANLTNANLNNANLTHADLGGVSLSGADLRGADLTGAKLRGAKLTGVMFDSTTCPNGAVTSTRC